MGKRGTRRRFLQSAALGSAAFTLGNGWSSSGHAGTKANSRLQIGIIGVAGQGNYNLDNVAHEEIVALCDVDENRAVASRQRFPKAKFYQDFRRLLDQPGLDAVVISTPDHTHAVATVGALNRGLHVYCEKPLTHSVHEARVVDDLATKKQRVTQMGTQIHAGNNYRRVVELIQSGAIGAVAEVHVWVDASYHGGDRPTDTPPVPKGLDYDLWLGPAPQRPYHSRYIPFHWRGWWDFGGGALADMACHFMDLPHWALRLGHPENIASEGPTRHPEGPPPWLIVRYEYPARDSMVPVKLTWYHGGKRPTEHSGILPQWGGGVLFVGEKGMLVANYGEHFLLPRERFAQFQPPKPSIPNSVGHHREWTEACKTGEPTTCQFSYSAVLTQAVLLGNVSYRLGRPITWNGVSGKVVNDAEAENYLHRPYRKGWSL